MWRKFGFALVVIGLSSSARNRAFAQQGDAGAYNPVDYVPLMRPVVGLESSTVRRELKLTDEQEKKALAIIEKTRQASKTAGFGAGLFRLPKEEKEARLAEYRKVMAAANDEATGLLTDEQMARFKQIRIWIPREQALFSREIIAELKLVTVQTDALTAIFEKYKTKMRELPPFNPRDEESRRKAFKEMDELEKSAGVEYLGVLTKEQREQFERMRGPRFEVDISEFPTIAGTGEIHRN